MTNPNTGNSRAHRVALYVHGEDGSLFVRDGYSGALEVASHTLAGTVRVATKLFAGRKIEGEATAYQRYSVWSLLE